MVTRPMEAPFLLEKERPLASRRIRPLDVAFRGFATASLLVTIGAALLLFAFLAEAGISGIRHAGLGSLLTGTRWKPEAGIFGGFPLLFGTLATATGAIVLGALPAVLAAVWVTELGPKALKTPFRRTMEIATALPSVVYGWLALQHLVPGMDQLAQLFHPGRAVGGEGLATSALLLAAMIAPTVSLLTLDALARIPLALREASSALGATSLQTAFSVVVPQAKSGILIAVFFGFARAAGETMAVQMVIGGARALPETAFSPATTISTQLVMEIQNTRPDSPESHVLYAMALILLCVSSTVVLTTRALSRKKA